jgi:hypothetical protein
VDVPGFPLAAVKPADRSKVELGSRHTAHRDRPGSRHHPERLCTARETARRGTPERPPAMTATSIKPLAQTVPLRANDETLPPPPTTKTSRPKRYPGNGPAGELDAARSLSREPDRRSSPQATTPSCRFVARGAVTPRLLLQQFPGPEAEASNRDRPHLKTAEAS